MKVSRRAFLNYLPYIFFYGRYYLLYWGEKLLDYLYFYFIGGMGDSRDKDMDLSYNF